MASFDTELSLFLPFAQRLGLRLLWLGGFLGKKTFVEFFS